MKHIPFFLIALSLSFPSFAQEGQPAAPAAAPPTVTPVQEAISPERLALAKKMHAIWPIRTRVESAISTVAKGFPEAKQPEIKAAMRKSIQFDQLEEESINAMAATFTEDELNAMIAFYGSETGRSISAKTGDYELAMRPIMVKMMDKAMLDLRTGMAR